MTVIFELLLEFLQIGLFSIGRRLRRYSAD